MLGIPYSHFNQHVNGDIQEKMRNAKHKHYKNAFKINNNKKRNETVFYDKKTLKYGEIIFWATQVVSIVMAIMRQNCCVSFTGSDLDCATLCHLLQQQQLTPLKNHFLTLL